MYHSEEITNLNNESNPNIRKTIILRKKFSPALKTIKIKKFSGIDDITSELIQNAGKKTFRTNC